MFDLTQITNKFTEQGISYMPKIAGALITLVLGWIIIKILISLFAKSMRTKHVDDTLEHFLVSLVGIILKALLIITVISMFGVQMTSFIAIVGAAGLAIGLALQGSLGNFAGGVLILLFKPFKIGDVIEAQGHKGKVSQIQIFNTILKTPDNRTIIIPNGGLSNGSLVNFSTEPERRVDFVFGIGYGDDIKKSRDVIEAIIVDDKRILEEPDYQVLVGELADNSVNFTVRVWVKAEDYWDVFFDMQEKVKLNFDKHGISIPYPQRDVHMFKH